MGHGETLCGFGERGGRERQRERHLGSETIAAVNRGTHTHVDVDVRALQTHGRVDRKEGHLSGLRPTIPLNDLAQELEALVPRVKAHDTPCIPGTRMRMKEEVNNGRAGRVSVLTSELEDLVHA